MLYYWEWKGSFFANALQIVAFESPQQDGGFPGVYDSAEGEVLWGTAKTCAKALPSQDRVN